MRPRVGLGYLIAHHHIHHVRNIPEFVLDIIELSDRTDCYILVLLSCKKSSVNWASGITCLIGSYNGPPVTDER